MDLYVNVKLDLTMIQTKNNAFCATSLIQTALSALSIVSILKEIVIYVLKAKPLKIKDTALFVETEPSIQLRIAMTEILMTTTGAPLLV